MGTLPEPSLALRAARVLPIAAGLVGWFWTQRILAAREWPAGRISDRVHEWTAAGNRYLREHPRAANGLLVVRAHYTMDVFTAIVVALGAGAVARSLAPPCDRFLAALVGG